MESATVLAFRIFVMLSCLVIVPMAAIFGSAFPDVVKTVLVDRIVAWSTGKTPEAAGGGAPSGFAAVTPGDPAAAPPPPGDPRWGQPNGQAAWQGEPSGHSQGVIPAAAIHVPNGNQPASYAAASDSAPPSVYGQHRPGGDAPADASGARVPQGHPSAAYGAQHGAPQPAEQSDRFTAMERKLREYGATYYLLETWGNDGGWYRFHCKMALRNNANYTRQFEATDRDALKAMAQVLEKVELWREGRLQ